MSHAHWVGGVYRVHVGPFSAFLQFCLRATRDRPGAPRFLRDVGAGSTPFSPLRSRRDWCNHYPISHLPKTVPPPLAPKHCTMSPLRFYHGNVSVLCVSGSPLPVLPELSSGRHSQDSTETLCRVPVCPPSLDVTRFPWPRGRGGRGSPS